MLFNRSDFDFHPGLAMAVFLVVARLLLVFDDFDSAIAADSINHSFDCGSGHVRSADSGFSAFDEENFIKGNFVANLQIAFDFLYFDDIAGFHLVLLAACVYDCEFHSGYKTTKNG